MSGIRGIFDSADPGFESQVRELVRHRLVPMAALLASRGLLDPGMEQVVRPLAGQQAVGMRERTAEDRRVLQALAAAGCAALALKGALLAHIVYPTPEARIRTDLDLLVAPASLAQARELLALLGYRRATEVEGGVPMTQEQWLARCGSRVAAVDLHWDLSNHPALRGLFGYAELAARAQPLPQVGPGVRGLGRVDALLHACVHWYGHHRSEIHPLQWLLDIDLLWRALAPEELAQLLQLASTKGLSGLLGSCLQLSARHFGTPLDAGLLATLLDQGRGQWRSWMARPYRSEFHDLWFALRSEPDWRARLHYLRLLLFPPASYMRRKYPAGSRLGLPGLYGRRLRAALGRAFGFGRGHKA